MAATESGDSKKRPLKKPKMDVFEDFIHLVGLICTANTPLGPKHMILIQPTQVHHVEVFWMSLSPSETFRGLQGSEKGS